jgi:hypothetical protein
MKTPDFILFTFLSLFCSASLSAQRGGASGWDSIYRMSDFPGERGSAGNRPGSTYVDGKRVGCICMDDTRGKTIGVGACSGHGGVRHWLYLKPGRVDTVRVPTDRHLAHPQPLTQEERANLSSANAAKGKRRKAALNDTVVMVHRFPDNLPVGRGSPQNRWIWQLSAVGATSLAGLFLGAAWQKRKQRNLAQAKRSEAGQPDAQASRQPGAAPGPHVPAERASDDLPL